MKKDITDKRLKELFNRELPDCPQNKWFSRKVMNRLPEHKSSRGAIIEYIGFMIATILLIFFWWKLLSEMDITNGINDEIIIDCSIMTATTIALVLGFVSTQLRKI